MPLQVSANTKQSIQALIQNTIQYMQKPLSQKAPPISDYASLRIQVIQEELRSETHALMTLMEQDNWVELFKMRCRERAARNENSSLSFFAMPEGVCNELYRKIATLIFMPKTLGQLLKVLLPEAVCVTCETVTDNQRSLAPQHLHLQFQEEPLSALEQLPNLEELGSFLCVDNRLLDISDVIHCNFPLQKMYHQTLNQVYPNLAQHLYQHNSAFRELSNDLLIVNGAGQPPLQVIRAFIKELKLGGQKMTGRTYASLSTQIAFTNFKAYLESLPKEMNMKEALLRLASKSGVTIQLVIDHLNAEKCVEIAAAGLQAILDNPINYQVLNTSPTLSAAELLTLEKKYGSHHPLPASGGETIIGLPNEHLKKVIKKIRIRNTDDFLSMLLSFPAELYGDFLQQIKKLPYGLEEMIKAGVLNQEQLFGFNQALVSNRAILGGTHKIIEFALATVNPDLLRRITQEADFASAGYAINRYSHYGDTALHCAANNPDLLKLILVSFPEADFLAIAKHANSEGFTALHLATQNPESLQIILKLYPNDEERLAAIQKKNWVGSTVLSFAANIPKSLQIILALIPEAQRLEAVKQRDNYDIMTLHYALSHPESLQIILDLYSEEDRIAALLQPAWYDNTAFHLAAKTPKSLQIILALIPEAQRLSVLEKKNVDGITPFYYAAKNLESLKVILALVPQVPIACLQKRNGRYNNTVLHVAAENPESLKAILERYPEEQRLAALQQKNIDNHTVFSLAINKHPRPIQIILDLLPQASFVELMATLTFSELLSVLHDVNVISKPELLTLILRLSHEQHRLSIVIERQNRSTLLHRAIAHPESFKAILEVLPEKDRLAALKRKNSDGHTVLQSVSHNLELQEIILQLLPKETHRSILEKRETPLFCNLSPDELTALYEKDNTHQTPRDAIKEQLHLFIIKRDSDSLNAWQALMSILATENHLRYDSHEDTVISQEAAAATEVSSKKSPTHLLLDIYFKPQTTNSDKQLVKVLLAEGQKTSTPSADWLALAIIADAEGQKKEKAGYINQLVSPPELVSSSSQTSRFRLFQRSKTKPNPEDVLYQLISKSPETAAFISTYQTPISEVLNIRETNGINPN